MTGWRMEGEKIILSFMTENSIQFDMELPQEFYEQILLEGPPTEEKLAREILNMIGNIKKNRVSTIDKVLQAEEDLRKEMQDTRKELKLAIDELKNAGDKHEVHKGSAVVAGLKAVLDSCTKEKSVLQEYRHLIKLTYQEEGKLRVRLLRKLRE